MPRSANPPTASGSSPISIAWVPGLDQQGAEITERWSV
jgi:hypothetical protein